MRRCLFSALLRLVGQNFLAALEAMLRLQTAKTYGRK
jgi:hypothetical protein